MAHIAALVNLPHTSGLPADVTVNTFHFDATTSTEDGLAITARLMNFYNDEGTGTNPIAYWLSGVIARTSNVCSIQLYDMTQAKPRVPFRTDFFTLEAPGSPTSYPSELAVCASFQADQESGSPQARRRGRVYLGPLTVASGVTSGGLPTMVSGDLRTSVRNASLALAVGAAADGVPWCVYSRVDNAIRPVTNGWVDNDFDVQRRRGPIATDRTTWTTSI